MGGRGSGRRPKIDEQAARDSLEVYRAAKPEKVIGRTAAARILGVSTTTVRRGEGRSLPAPIKVDGMNVFREDEIRAISIRTRIGSAKDTGGLSSAYTGEKAAEVFGLFDDGTNPIDVVKRLKLHPELVELLFLQWTRLREYVVLPGIALRELEQIPGVCGTFPLRTADHVLELVRESIRAARVR
jgi:hypothetical protein